MMLVNKSPRRNSLKLLALLPIVGVTLALNAETVTDVVYKNDEPQKQVPVKKGKKDTTIKTNPNQGIQVIEASEAADKKKTYETAVKQEAEQNEAAIVYDSKPEGKKPLLIVDGKITPIDQVRTLPRVVKVATMREKAAIRSFGEKAKYGALIITTVNQQKEIDNEKISQPDVFDEVDEMPQFPGGMAGLMQYLSTNVRYPEDAKESGAQGRVIVSFIVEKDGSISNARVTKPTYSSLDDEALRVVSAMPKWVPGKQNGEAVRVKYAVPVTFRLKGEDLLSGMSESTSFKDLTNRLPGAEIDENGKIFINGKEVKRLVFDGSENDIGIAIMNIMLKDPDRFDYEVDGEPVTVKDMKEKNASKTNPIKKIEYVAKDSEHPKDRLLITTK